jgi:SAM-dependent methyltransferase
MMGQAIQRWVATDARILDIGAQDINGTYRDVVGQREYVGADIQAGPGVDVVMTDPYTLPFENGEFGAVISGQTLEHCRDPHRLVGEMARVLAPGGIMVLIAPTRGPEHRAPVDCWRMLPDAMTVLGEDAGLEVIEISLANEAPWFDLRGAYRRPANG